MTVYTPSTLTCAIVLVSGALALTACTDDEVPELADVAPQLEVLVAQQESVEFISTVSQPTGKQVLTFTGELEGTSLFTQDGFAGVESHLNHEGRLYFSMAGQTLVEHLTFLGMDSDIDVVAFAEAADGLWFEEETSGMPAADPSEFLATALRSSVLDVPTGVQGEKTTYEGQAVWRYRFGEEELILHADPHAPLPLRISGVEPDGVPAVMEYRQWNQAKLPEIPDDDELLSNAEFRALFEDHAL